MLWVVAFQQRRLWLPVHTETVHQPGHLPLGPRERRCGRRGPGGACGLASLGAKELKSHWCSVPGGQKQPFVERRCFYIPVYLWT